MSITLRREFVYIWYYFDMQFRQIFVYWVLGMLVGSLVSVFAKDKIHNLFASMRNENSCSAIFSHCGKGRKHYKSCGCTSYHAAYVKLPVISNGG